MRIAIGADHAGYIMKSHLIQTLRNLGHEVVDVGAHVSDPSDDYPDFANKLSKKVASNKGSFGILICGSGTGMAIAANKTKNIRAALCYSKKNTELSRLHNNANIITLGERLIDKNNAFSLIKIFLSTKFEGGRHLRRVKKI